MPPFVALRARVEEKTVRVDHWRTSDQKWRWCAAALLAVEKQFRCMKCFRQLPLLQQALRAKIAVASQAAA